MVRSTARAIIKRHLKRRAREGIGHPTISSALQLALGGLGAGGSVVLASEFFIDQITNVQERLAYQAAVELREETEDMSLFKCMFAGASDS